MSNKILTYATCTGSTAGVAEEIGKTLTDRGMEVEVLPMSVVENLGVWKEGDHRNWDAIRSWTESLLAKLTG